MTNMDDQIKALQEKIRADRGTKHARMRTMCKAAGPSAVAMFAELEKREGIMEANARMTRSKVEKLRADKTIYPEGRDLLIAEALAKGKAEHEAAWRKLEALTRVIQAQIAVAATPRVPVNPVEKDMKQRELYMNVRDQPDPLQAMLDAVQRDESLAGVAASSYGESLLRGQRTFQPKQAHATVVKVARAVAVNSADPQLRAAAEAYHAVGESEGLGGLTAPTLYLARTDLEAAEKGEPSE